MKSKINRSLSWIAVLAVLSTLVGITCLYYSLFEKQVRTDLSVTAKLLRDSCCFDILHDDIGNIDFSEGKEQLRVTWVDADGTVLYDNDVTTFDMANHLDRPEIRQAFETGEGESVRRSDTMNTNTYYYAILLDNGTVLRVSAEAQSLGSVFLSASPVIALIILLIITICVFLSHLLTKQLLKPIEMMAQNLENADYESPYRELDPFSEMLRSQHTDILSAVKARQDFTANVSHELKTPLTAISGYAELLENDMVSEDKKHHFYSEIHKNSDRLLALINDIIRMSELDRGGPDPAFEEINLNEAVAECIDALSVNAASREVTLTYTGEDVTIRASRDMIKELVENLAQNAIRYNNPGGRVTITVASRDSRGVLIVSDNGIGIPAGEQNRIFERFYRVDKSRSKATGGTGLGLAIVKHIVEIHEATISLDSAPGVGTTVTVVF